MSAHGRYDRIEGRLALRYERHMPHSIEAVWAAVTQPAGLASWFPCRIEGYRRGRAAALRLPCGQLRGRPAEPR